MAKKAVKKTASDEVVKTTIDIRTKGKHAEFLAWHLDQLPDIYSPAVITTDTGYKVEVLYDGDTEGNTFFVARYLASLVQEIKTLDESNLKIERIAVTETEQEEVAG